MVCAPHISYYHNIDKTKTIANFSVIILVSIAVQRVINPIIVGYRTIVQR